MPLPTPANRTLVHNRDVVFRGYRRDDGLWDIEGEMRDTKPHPFEIKGEGVWQPGQPFHHMLIRATINNDMVVQAIEVAMDAVPHGPCPQAMDNMQRMVGHTMGPGWRQAIDKHLGKLQGCAHLRELLFNMATAAYQTMPPLWDEEDLSHPPQHLGRCVAWDYNGPVVERIYPMFFRRDPRAATQP